MNWNGLNRLLLGGVLCGALITAGKIHADEESLQTLTVLSSSSLSGVIETTSIFTYGGSGSTFDPATGEVRPIGPMVLTGPGSFTGANTPPTAVETIIYFSPPQPHSSGGSRSSTPDEVASDESFSMSGMSNETDFPVVTVNDMTTIPEPSTVALFLGGAGLLVIRMRRKA